MRSIAKLGLFGFIVIEPPTADRASNTYTIRMDKLVAASMLTPKAQGQGEGNQGLGEGRVRHERGR